MIRWWRKSFLQRRDEPSLRNSGSTRGRLDSLLLDNLCAMRKYRHAVTELVMLRRILPHFRWLTSQRKNSPPESQRPTPRFTIHTLVDILTGYLAVSEEMQAICHTPFTQPLRQEVEFFLAVHHSYGEEENLEITFDRILLISELELIAISGSERKGSTW